MPKRTETPSPQAGSLIGDIVLSIALFVAVSALTVAGAAVTLAKFGIAFHFLKML